MIKSVDTNIFYKKIDKAIYICIFAILKVDSMFVQKFIKKVGSKVYQSILLLESFRENGKVKHRTVANLSKMPTALVDGIDKQLRGGQITSLGDLDYSQGKSCGSLIVIKEACKRLGILDALGNSGRNNIEERLFY